MSKSNAASPKRLTREQRRAIQRERALKYANQRRQTVIDPATGREVENIALYRGEQAIYAQYQAAQAAVAQPASQQRVQSPARHKKGHRRKKSDTALHPSTTVSPIFLASQQPPHGFETPLQTVERQYRPPQHREEVSPYTTPVTSPQRPARRAVVSHTPYAAATTTTTTTQPKALNLDVATITDSENDTVDTTNESANATLTVIVADDEKLTPRKQFLLDEVNRLKTQVRALSDSQRHIAVKLKKPDGTEETITIDVAKLEASNRELVALHFRQQDVGKPKVKQRRGQEQVSISAANNAEFEAIKQALRTARIEQSEHKHQANQQAGHIVIDKDIATWQMQGRSTPVARVQLQQNKPRVLECQGALPPISQSPALRMQNPAAARQRRGANQRDIQPREQRQHTRHQSGQPHRHHSMGDVYGSKSHRRRNKRAESAPNMLENRRRYHRESHANGHHR